MSTSTAKSFVTDAVFKEHVVTGAYATGFTLGLLAKDVAIAATLAEAAGVDAPLCSISRERWAEAWAGLGGAVDHSEAHKQWWRRAPNATAGCDDGA
jgi:3-hydroxyisobutyrate dehydrogenase